MTPSHFGKIERLYHAARELAADERAAFLDQACGGDQELRRELESLLAEDAAASNLLDRGAWETEPSGIEDTSAPLFAVGAEIGSYRIEGPIGEGGMGVVYKALDTRLNRPVAVKLLSNRLADVAARRRFQREARMASSLNHPHILTVHDAGEYEGQQYLVTEYIDGGTLRDWNRSGGRTWQEIVELLTGVADGLATAHEAKILHRDIKPANILVMKSGYAKLADFGLAKLTEASPASTDGTKTAQTRPGMVVGTIAYMSPEQAQGKVTDARSDVFSFGVVLYEMLEGRRPFEGRSDLETLQKVIDEEAAALREHLPVALRALVQKALQKDPAKRYQSARGMVADLRTLARGSEAPVLSEPKPPEPLSPKRGSRRVWFSAAGATALVLAGAAAWYLGGRRGGPVAIPSEFVQLTNLADYATAPAISRDGTMLAFFRGGSYYLGTGQVHVKLLSSGESKQLTNDSFRKYSPVFTPDGSRVAYTALNSTVGAFETWTTPVLGGAPSRLMSNAAGLSWLAPDRILFSEIMPGSVVHMGIVTARESRAEERRIYFPSHERGMAHYSYPSPNQRSILVVEMDSSQAWLPCRLVPMDGSSSGSQIGPQGACTAAAWSPDGKWMYLITEVNGSTHLWRQRYPDGAPEQITFGPTEEEGLAIMPDGKSLITSLGLKQSSIWLKDAAGDHRLPVDGPPSQPRFSADGQRLYYLVKKGSSRDSTELWARDLATGKTDLILTRQNILDYDISQDQASVTFTLETGGAKSIFVASVDRGTPPRLVTRDGDEVSFAGPMNILFRQLAGKANFLARIHKDGTGLTRVLDTPIADKGGGSPDGVWAIVSGWVGPSSVEGTYIISLRDQSSRYLAKNPCVVQWSSDGKFLFVTLDHSAADVKETTGSSGRTLVIPLPRGVAEAAIPAAGFDPASHEELNGIQMIPRWLVAPRFDANTYAYVATEFQGNLFQIPLHLQ